MTGTPTDDVEPARAVPEASRFAFRDAVDESLAGIWARPGRSILTTLGVVLGIGALVAVVGISSSAGTQIVADFNELLATTVVVEPARGSDDTPLIALPWDAEDRLMRLNGVVAAGSRTNIDVRGARVRTSSMTDPSGLTEFDLPVVAISPRLFDVMDARLTQGRTFDSGHDSRADPVAVLGPAAAQRLGIVRVDNQPVVFVGDQPFTVVGILDVDGVSRLPSLLSAILIPNGTAKRAGGVESPASLIVATELGAPQQVAREAPVALAPNTPDLIVAAAELDPRALRQRIAENVTSLFVLLGIVALVVGALGIANVTLVSVLERVPEIGLRRALGARRHHIATQFLLESTLLGLVGGLFGSSTGVLTTVAVAISRDWLPVLPPVVPLTAPMVGALVGLVAGAYPARRAATVDPIIALRAG